MKTTFFSTLLLISTGLNAAALPQVGSLQPASVTAKAAGLSSLVDALVTAGLATTVDGLKDVTIFAPTNDAFAAIATTAKTLTKDQLANVLKYHVVPKTAFSKDLSNGMTVKTLQGGELKIMLMGNKVMVNGANVVKADVPITGGVVHVIDKYALILQSPEYNC